MLYLWISIKPHAVARAEHLVSYELGEPNLVDAGLYCRYETTLLILKELLRGALHSLRRIPSLQVIYDSDVVQLLAIFWNVFVSIVDVIIVLVALHSDVKRVVHESLWVEKLGVLPDDFVQTLNRLVTQIDDGTLAELSALLTDGLIQQTNVFILEHANTWVYWQCASHFLVHCRDFGTVIAKAHFAEVVSRWLVVAYLWRAHVLEHLLLVSSVEAYNACIWCDKLMVHFDSSLHTEWHHPTNCATLQVKVVHEQISIFELCRVLHYDNVDRRELRHFYSEHTVDSCKHWPISSLP